MYFHSPSIKQQALVGQYLNDSVDWCQTLRLLPIPPVLPLFFFLSRTEEPVKAGTCARDRRALQQLALNAHVKHSDLT